MSSKEHKQKIWNYIKDIKVGMLTTQDGDDLRSRPMHLVQKDYDGTLYFFTRRSAEKVFEIKDEHHVNISFAEPKDDLYVSMSGTARLTQDAALIDKFWNPFTAAWFEGDQDNSDVAILEVKIKMGEHWKTEKGETAQLFEIAKANLTNDTPDLGENQKFGTK